MKSTLHILFLLLTFQLTAQELSVDNRTSLLLHMDGDLNGVQGESPANSSGISFSSGKINQAANFSNSSTLNYANANNINSSQGTIEAWVRLNNDADDGTKRTIFSWGYNGGMLFSKDGINNLRLIINRFGSNGAGDEQQVVATIGNWRANDWHHVACSWSSNELKLYIDGIRVDTKIMNFTPPSISNANFFVGSDRGGSDWNGRIDEFRISTVQRTDDEIAQSAGIDFGNVSANKNNFVQQSNLVIVLRNNDGITNNASLSSIRNIADEVTSFYWKHSYHSLLLDWTFREVNYSTDVLDNANQYVEFDKVKAVLNNEGFTDDQFDAVVMILKDSGNFAYGVNKVLNSAAFTQLKWNNSFTEDRWVFTHEYNHLVDAMMQASGTPEYSHNHPADTRAQGEFLPPSGADFDLNALFMHVITKLQWIKIAEIGSWGIKRAFSDTDGDGFANADSRLPIDEARFGSNPNAKNADGDQLNDLEEHVAGIFESTNPNNADTDGDGMIDGVDLQPLYSFPESIPFQQTNVGSTNLSQYAYFGSYDGTDIYANNNQSHLHLAIDNIPYSGRYEILLDLKNDGVFYSRDNLLLAINNGNLEQLVLRDAAANPAVDFTETVLSNSTISFKSSGDNTTVFISIPFSSNYGLALQSDDKVGLRINQARTFVFDDDDFLSFGLGVQGQGCTQVSASCVSFESNLGFWTQASNDDLDWRVDSNGTPTSSTGPSNATNGSNYIYVESSLSGIGYPNKTARLESECIRLTGLSNPALSFNVHMYGSSMGTLEVEVEDVNSGSSRVEFSISGNQGNAWMNKTVDLSSYIGRDIIISFNATTASSYRSDFALDEVCLEDINCASGSACDDGDECTINDTYNTNCVCVGTAFNPFISGITYGNNDVGCREVNSFTINYPRTLPFSKFRISINGGSSYWIVNTSDGSRTFNKPAGDYDVFIQTIEGDCEKYMTTVNIPEPPDADNDGICDAEDPCVNDPSNNCNAGGCNELNTTDFESGWGFWQDGGTNAILLTNATYANSGNSSIYIRGNTSTSVIRSNRFDHNGDVKLNFHLYAFSMETGDKFHVEVKNDNLSWTRKKTYTSGTEFNNSERKSFELLISDFDFNANAQIRFKSETNSTSDYVFLDDIVISFCGGNVCIDIDGDGICADEDPNDADPCNPNSCAGVDCTRDSRIDQTCAYDISFDNTFGLWVNSASNNKDWVRRSGNTPSSSTGPSGAAHGSHYIYVESSSNGIGFPNKIAILESPCYKVPSGAGIYVNFRYHMYGANMGSLVLEITTDDNNWDVLWSKSGDQGNQWNTQRVNVTNYANQSVRLRFKATTGASYRSDIALDLVQSRCINDFSQVSTREITDQSFLNVFPNPVKDQLNILYNSSSTNDIELQIFDQIGALIINESLSKPNDNLSLQYNLSNLKSGIYHLRIKQNEKFESKRFVLIK